MSILIKMIFSTAIIFSLSGCLLFHKISYDVQVEENGRGTATVVFSDIRSDARSDSEFEEDKKNLFDYIYKSDDFVTEIKKEGKNVVLRDLFTAGDTLKGKAVFKFNNISAVEGIVSEDGFFYLTLPVEDSVISTNGEIIQSKGYKRILWDGKLKNLQFEIYSTDFAEGKNRKLTQYLKE